MFRTILLLFLFLAACSDETITGFSDPATTWRLKEINGAAFAARATLTFPEKGKIAGQAPCNRFAGPVDAIYPWFKTGALAVTRMACPNLADETDFLAALDAVTLAEISGPVLVLSNENGLEMVFEAE